MDNTDKDLINEDLLPKEILSVDEEEIEASERTEADYFMMGINAYIHGMYEDAIDYFNSYILQDEKNAKGYVNRGDVYAEKGDYQEAFNDYNVAIFLGSKEAYGMREELFEELVSKRIIKLEDRKRLCPNI